MNFCQSLGRILAFDIANFAKESVSSRLQTLDPNQFEDKVSNPLPTVDNKPWFVDFFAPVCHLCYNYEKIIIFRFKLNKINN